MDFLKTQLTKVAGLLASNPPTGDASGCITLMLVNVQKNLADVKGIHQDPQQCASSNPQFATCLRPAAAQDALAISNQTIDAVLYVEHALKREDKK